MKVLRLTLSLLVCVPGCALLGAMAAADSWFSAWGGAVIGPLLGMFFGLAYGGVRRQFNVRTTEWDSNREPSRTA